MKHSQLHVSQVKWRTDRTLSQKYFPILVIRVVQAWLRFRKAIQGWGELQELALALCTVCSSVSCFRGRDLGPGKLCQSLIERLGVLRFLYELKPLAYLEQKASSPNFLLNSPPILLYPLTTQAQSSPYLYRQDSSLFHFILHWNLISKGFLCVF